MGKKYQFKTQCSENHPFERKVGGGGNVFFTDSKLLVNYLENSEEARYMWTDSEDLVVISDMYQVAIKIITTKGAYDDNPIVNWIKPDPEMKEFAEIKNVDIDEMVLIHENDSHFNLVVAEDSELATIGSLSLRSNIGPMVKATEKEEVGKINEDIENTDLSDTIKQYKTELLKEKQKNKYLENDTTKEGTHRVNTILQPFFR